MLLLVEFDAVLAEASAGYAWRGVDTAATGRMAPSSARAAVTAWVYERDHGPGSCRGQPLSSVEASAARSQSTSAAMWCRLSASTLACDSRPGFTWEHTGLRPVCGIEGCEGSRPMQRAEGA